MLPTTKAQYEELENLNMCCDAEEFNKLLEEYTGIGARPYTAYQFFNSDGDYVGDSNENDLDDLLRAAYVEVRDG